MRSLADARNLGGEVFVVVGSWFVVGEWGPLPAGRGSVTGVGAGEAFVVRCWGMGDRWGGEVFGVVGEWGTVYFCAV